MKKLSLQLDDLTVESFHVQDAPRERGTVMGHDTVRCTNTCDTLNNYTCDGQATCGGQTCGNLYTCQGDGCGGTGADQCPQTEDASCQQVSCIIWSCVTCDQSCSCLANCP